MKTRSQRSRIQLQLRELIEDISSAKPRLNRFNKGFEYEFYEYDRGVYVVDVSGVEGFIRSGGKVTKNLILSNWWALFLGLLRDVNAGDVLDVGGAACTLRTSGDVNAASAVIEYGIGTTPASFTDRSLASAVLTLSTAITVGYLADRVRLSFSGTLPGTAYELGIRQALIDTVPGTRTILLTRAVGSWSAGQGIAYNIDFAAPWVRGIGDIMYGIHSNANVPATRIDGVTFTARTTAEVNAGSAYLVASSSPVAWSPTLVSIPEAFTLTNYYVDILDKRSVRMMSIIGLIAPANDIEVNALALYQPIYDTTGATHTVCMAVLALASPITFYANRNNLVVWRIIAL